MNLDTAHNGVLRCEDLRSGQHLVMSETQAQSSVNSLLASFGKVEADSFEYSQFLVPVFQKDFVLTNPLLTKVFGFINTEQLPLFPVEKLRTRIEMEKNEEWSQMLKELRIPTEGEIDLKMFKKLAVRRTEDC